MSDDVQYPDHFVERLEILWGAGFLSPGGPDEVRQIVEGLELAGRSVLDVGCGNGGPTIVLAGDLGAGEVVGIDIEPQLLDRARGHVARAGLETRIAFQAVTPGPLPASTWSSARTRWSTSRTRPASSARRGVSSSPAAISR